MHELVAGQNVPVDTGQLTFRVNASGSDLDLVGLVVDSGLRVLGSDDVVFYNQPASAGVRLVDGQLTVDVGALRAGATVLCAVAFGDDTPATELTAELIGSPGVVLFTFAIRPAYGETALLCFELYQRSGLWRVRALGQGYRGGLAQLLTTHGVDVDDAPKPPTQLESVRSTSAVGESISKSTPDPAAVALGTDYTAAIARAQVVFEDAARSAAGYVQAEAFAVDRLDKELSEALADPAQRNSPAAAQKREAAQRRCDELVAAARTRFDADSAVLIAELAALDPQLPPAMASWASPAWNRTGGLAASGIRIGEFAAPERGELTLPFCVPTPIARPIWVLDGDQPVAPVVTSLVLRLTVAAQALPIGRTSTGSAGRVIIDVFDLTGSLNSVTELLGPLLASPAVRSADGVADRLTTLESALELSQMALEAGEFADLSSRVVVISDLPFGWEPSGLARLLRVIDRGGQLGWSFVLSGTVDELDGDPLVNTIADRTLMFPVSDTATAHDPWVGLQWLVRPEQIDPQSAQARGIVAALSAPQQQSDVRRLN